MRRSKTVFDALPEVYHYRPRVPGPEQELADRLLAGFSRVIGGDTGWWLASSLPLGAGLPDLIAARDNGALSGVRALGRDAVEVLAYLRAVGAARRETIASRLRLPLCSVDVTANFLSEEGAVELRADVLRLTPTWRKVLREVVAVELKVSHWRGALLQAARNRVFAHRSFVALPASLASRVRTAPEFGRVGVGLLGVAHDGEVSVVRRARGSSPLAWRYYYQLAARVVESPKPHALSRTD